MVGSQRFSVALRMCVKGSIDVLRCFQMFSGLSLAFKDVLETFSRCPEDVLMVFSDIHCCSQTVLRYSQDVL